MVLCKRTREDEEEDVPSLLSPSATPPSIGNKRQRRVPPPLDAQARGSLQTGSNDNGLGLDLGKSPEGVPSNVRVTLRKPGENSADEQPEDEEDEDYEYDPEDIIPFGSSSGDDGDADEEDAIKGDAPESYARPEPPPSQLSAMNALLHELHTSHKRRSPHPTTPRSIPSKEPIASSSKPYRPPMSELSSSLYRRISQSEALAFACTTYKRGAYEARAWPPQGVNDDGERATVIARYEETNRLLGSLFLTRRRQVNPTEELEEL
ncbi:hypothetical protein BS47DRAFT_1343922 [Hydnum rufescens UP504]|uniref:Uncharacterized protein n=1 Tax=Hydnum rufescens UP504 TaxID=1448309 RepID=A0A9P6AX94_9AGAM|nr:hypothetical protein BS47DRAFT_1343922 [Hydnum rufescens UP504]